MYYLFTKRLYLMSFLFCYITSQKFGIIRTFYVFLPGQIYSDIVKIKLLQFNIFF